MIRPISSVLNKNNTVNNKVNFQGTGKIVRVKPYQLDYLTLLSFRELKTKGQDGNKFLGVLANLLHVPVEKVRQYYAGAKANLEEVNEGFLKLLDETLPTPEMRQSSQAADRHFKPRFTQFLTEHELMQDGNFTHIPAESMRIESGEEVIPDHYEDLATLVTCHGAELENPRFRHVLFTSTEIPEQTVKADFANVYTSEISGFDGGVFSIGQSTVYGDVVSTTVKAGAGADMLGDVVTPAIIVDEADKVVIQGRLGTPEKPLRLIQIEDGGSLKVREVHAKNPPKILGAGNFEAGIVDIPSLTWWQKLSYLGESRL